jgi:acetone carboxylase gamma subunit
LRKQAKKRYTFMTRYVYYDSFTGKKHIKINQKHLCPYCGHEDNCTCANPWYNYGEWEFESLETEEPV